MSQNLAVIPPVRPTKYVVALLVAGATMAYLANGLFSGSPSSRTLLEHSHRLQHESGQFIRSLLAAKLSAGSNEQSALESEPSAALSAWEAHHTQWQIDLATYAAEDDGAAHIVELSAAATEQFQVLRTLGRSSSGDNGLHLQQLESALKAHRYYVKSIDTVREQLTLSGDLQRGQAATYLLVAGLTVLALAATIVFAYGNAFKRVSDSIDGIAEWNATRLDEVLTIKKQQNDLAREIFASRRAEEELRSALADVWAVAAKMKSEPEEQNLSLKAAIPMLPKSRVSG